MKLELIDVHKSFKDKEVLRGIDLVLPEGKTTVVIGPSGGGKSTILRLLLRLIVPERGRILVDGQDLLAFDQKQLNAYRLKVGMVFQMAALFDSLTIGENVAFSLLENSDLSHEEMLKIAVEKLKLVDLPDTEDLYPAELSGGMKKRASFARAIARDPKAVLYDEPTTGLDPITSTVIEDLIKSLQQHTKATSVVVTHQLSTIFRTADVIAMIYEGRIIGTGTPEEFRDHPNPIINQFIEGRVEVEKKTTAGPDPADRPAGAVQMDFIQPRPGEGQ